MYEKLREKRKKKNISASSISEKLGLKTVGAYYKKEWGTVPITVTEAQLICELLQSSLDEIFLPSDNLVKIEE